MEAVTRMLDFALSAKTPDFLTPYAPQVAALRKLESADRAGELPHARAGVKWAASLK